MPKVLQENVNGIELLSTPIDEVDFFGITNWMFIILNENNRNNNVALKVHIIYVSNWSWE